MRRNASCKNFDPKEPRSVDEGRVGAPELLEVPAQVHPIQALGVRRFVVVIPIPRPVEYEYIAREFVGLSEPRGTR